MADVDLNDLALLDAVVRFESFSAAARELGLPASSVSRRIARLEQAAGAVLLKRTTRSVALTEAGRLFHGQTSSIPGHVQDAVRAVASLQSAPRGVLKVAAPPDHGGVITTLLTAFMSEYPDVDVHVRHTLERVDLLGEGVDVAIRGGQAPDTSVYTARKLFDSRILLAASPEYLAEHGTPQRAEDLADHWGLCMDPWAPNGLRRLDGDRGLVNISLRNRLRANSLHTAQLAALAGLGIAPLLALTCSQELADGRLVEVCPGALPDHAPMWVLSPLSRVKSAAATAFVDSACATAAGLSLGEAAPG